jgi:hypothetical protein
LNVKFEDSAYHGPGGLKNDEVTTTSSLTTTTSKAVPRTSSMEQFVAPSTNQFVIPKEPKTMTEFTRDWRMCKTRGISTLYQYMKVRN